jgi:hypothetical protein
MSYRKLETDQALMRRAWNVVISTESSVGEGYAKAIEIANNELIGAENLSGGLHFSFDIVKDLTAEPNKCTLRIFNLSKDVRNALDGLSIFDPKKPRGAKKAGPRVMDNELHHRKSSTSKTARVPKTGKIRVEIRAGYVETGMSLLFRGDLRNASSRYTEDGSWETTIEGEDGGRTTLSSRINESFAPGTSHMTVVRACLDAMGLGQGNLVEVQHLLGAVYPRGTVCSGSAASELTGVLKRARISYTIHDGIVEFRPLVGELKRTKSVLLSKDSGLVGAPVRQTTGLVEVTSLLNPQISLGGYVTIDSETLSGDYYVQRIQYEGSNYTDSWYAICELRSY